MSVIPPSRTECKHSQQAFTLQAVNNTTITTYGCKSLTLDLGLCRTFRWIFIIADVQNPILSADFLRSYSLLVDMKHNKLLDSLTQLRVQGIVSQKSSPSPTFLNIQPTNEFESILFNFPDVTHPQCGNNPIKHDVTHHIKTHSRVSAAKKPRNTCGHTPVCYLCDRSGSRFQPIITQKLWHLFLPNLHILMSSYTVPYIPNLK